MRVSVRRLCMWVTMQKKVERRGEREFALCPFQPSVFLCVSAPFFLFHVPSFSSRQSSLSVCHFTLKWICSCFSGFFFLPSSLPFFKFHHQSSFFYCLTVLLRYVLLWWLVETGNYSLSTHDQCPNTHSSLCGVTLPHKNESFLATSNQNMSSCPFGIVPDSDKPTFAVLLLWWRVLWISICSSYISLEVLHSLFSRLVFFGVQARLPHISILLYHVFCPLEHCSASLPPVWLS